MAHPKAYEPQQGYKFQILCRNQQYTGKEWEHCDYATDSADKKHLLSNYRLAYGAGWEFKTILLPKKYHAKEVPPTGFDITSLSNSNNGQPRLCIHFFALLNERERSIIDKIAPQMGDSIGIDTMYDYAIYKAKKIKGKKFHNKQFGGGIVFRKYKDDLIEAINNIKCQDFLTAWLPKPLRQYAQ